VVLLQGEERKHCQMYVLLDVSITFRFCIVSTFCSSPSTVCMFLGGQLVQSVTASRDRVTCATLLPYHHISNRSCRKSMKRSEGASRKRYALLFSSLLNSAERMTRGKLEKLRRLKSALSSSSPACNSFNTSHSENMVAPVSHEPVNGEFCHPSILSTIIVTRRARHSRRSRSEDRTDERYSRRR
jgi:hypothetical protein